MGVAVGWEGADIKSRVSSNKIIVSPVSPSFLLSFLVTQISGKGKIWAVNSFQQSNDNSGAVRRAVNKEPAWL